VFAVVPSSTFTIAPGVYPGAPSYTVWREGSNYFAKDANGLLAYSGTNASQIIQNTIDTLDVGSILIKNVNSAYDIDSSIFLKSNVNMLSDGAELTPIGTKYQPIFVLGETSNIIIKGFYFYGANASYEHADQRAIATSIGEWYEGVEGGSNIQILNNKFDNWNHAHSVDIYESQNILLNGNLIGDCSGFGTGNRCYRVTITNNIVFESTTDYAIMAVGNQHKNVHVIISGNHLSSSPSSGNGGIDVIASDAIISNNIIDNPDQWCIYVHDNFAYDGTDRPTEIIIEGNICIGNSVDMSIQIENYDETSMGLIVRNNICTRGIHLTNIVDATIEGNDVGTLTGSNQAIEVYEGSNIAFIGNRLHSCYYCIFGYDDHTPTNVLVTNNKMSYIGDGVYNLQGLVEHNDGLITENWGLATGTSPINATHGLTNGRIPNIVTLTVNGAVPYKTSWTADTTSIYIYHDANASITVTWYAEYRP
jgi:hypothetical protein